MNPYSDIPFYIQSLLSDEDDYGVILLLTLTPRYVAPKEYVEAWGTQINKTAFKELQGYPTIESVVASDPQMTIPAGIKWKTEYTYAVTREKLPLYTIPEKHELSKYAFPRLRADPPGGTLFEIGEVMPSPFPEPKFDIWRRIYNMDPGGSWIHPESVEYIPRLKPINYIKTKIHLDKKDG